MFYSLNLQCILNSYHHINKKFHQGVMSDEAVYLGNDPDMTSLTLPIFLIKKKYIPLVLFM